MTNESRSFIDLTDFIGVEFECGHCHARLLYKLPEKPVRVVFQCPNCNERFYNADRQRDFEQFFNLLTQMPQLVSEGKAKIKVQIALPESRP